MYLNNFLQTHITVTVESTDDVTFKKMFLYAAGNTNQVGIWQKLPDTLKGATCTEANDAVTHSDGVVEKKKVTLEWVAEKDLGDIEFRLKYI